MKKDHYNRGSKMEKLDEMVEKVTAGEADIAVECIDKVEQWIDGLSDEEIRTIIEKKQWVMETGISADAEITKIRRWMKSMLHEDSSFVAMTLQGFIEADEMPADFFEIEVEEGVECD